MASPLHPIRSSLEVAKFHAKHLSLEDQLTDLVNHLPEILTFPFSGVIAFQVGDEFIVQACHCPNQLEFTADQPFNVLSVGKLFTATAVMQLIEEGKLSLNTPLSELLTEDEFDLPLRSPYLEEKPEPDALEDLKKHAAKITLEHLLTHRSGLGKINETDIRESYDPNNIGTFNYSNYGYQLLARIIGKHSGDGNILDHEAGFRNHVEKRIFKLAGMEGAIREIHSPIINKPDCFEISKEGNPMKDETLEPYPHGNGCWRMTASDLLAFERAQRSY